MPIEVQSFTVVNRYDSDIVLHDSKDYPEFEGKSWNDFILFLVNKKANLSEANLSGVYLSEAYLSEANLSGAYLSEANLSEAKLYKANLSGANLYKAKLYKANLYKANLSEANLSGANLLNSARNKIKGVNCLEFNFDNCFGFLLVKNQKTAHLQIGCKKHNLEEWKLEFNENNEYIDNCNDEAHYNLHKEKFFKYLPLFEEFLKEY